MVGGGAAGSEQTYRSILTPAEQAEFEALRIKYPGWMPAEGLDAPARVRSVAENALARSASTGCGHHREPLKFGGDPNPSDMVPTGESRTEKNPVHTEVSNFWYSVWRRIHLEEASQ